MALPSLPTPIRQTSVFRSCCIPRVACVSRYPAMQRHYATAEQRPLMSAAELKQSILCKSGPVILDCTWFMPNVPRNPQEEFKQSRIPGARFFNLDEVIDKSSPYPHMLPSAEDFAMALGNLGIKPGDHVCCYDTHGIFSSPRVWWTFKVFGHKRVSVLDGGLPAWKREGGELESSPPEAYAATEYPVPDKDDSLVRSFEQITEIAQQVNRSVQILDARSAGRFTGRDPEPRKGLSSGHIPGSISMPFQVLLNPETNQYRSAEELRAYFQKELDPSKETIMSCGTGVTASIIYLALEASGFPPKRSLYDGSWTEYAARHADSAGMIVKDV